MSNTDRYTHRDRTEKLLACLEAIDDDLIAEAAQTVNNQTRRRFQWLSWGNVAAVFIGAVAVSCVVLLAFWLSGMGEGVATNDNGGNGYGNAENGYGNNGGYGSGDNGYSNGPYHIDATPSPIPVQPTFDDGLPLRQISETSHLTILPAGRYRMTENNPWFTIGHIEELPVFLPHAITNLVGSPGNWRSVLENNLSEVEHEEYLRRTASMAIMIADIAGVPINEAESTIESRFMDLRTQELDVFMHMRMDNPAMSITFPEDTMMLPPGASLSESARPEAVQAAIEYLAETFREVIPMRVPTLTLGEITLDIGGPRMYSRQRFFDAGGSPYFGGNDPVGAILNFNFNWVEVLTFQPDRPMWMHVSTFPQAQFESLQLGNFPIITSDEARQMLLDGYFISDMPDSQWPGAVLAWAADVELVYHNNGEVIMPMYRFLIEADLPLWAVEDPSDWVAFARYYVPAIHRDYLEPMTRRATPEPIEAPTGPRSLPENVFRHLNANADDLWRAIRFPRHMVEELWQEVMSDIGGLAVNEAYQFRTACGHYALITGSRTLTSREELRRYYPALDVPERVGGAYELREIFVYDQTKDRMFISNRPIGSQENFYLSFGAAGTPAPVGEIFVRDLDINGYTIAFSFAAMYQCIKGSQIGLGVSSAFFELPSVIDGPYETLDMGEYGLIYFQGGHREGGRQVFYRALYEPTDPWEGIFVEMWFINGPVSNRRGFWDLRLLPDSVGIDSELVLYGADMFSPAPRETLEYLVQVFDPSALAAEYQWQLMSWQ